MRYRSMSKGFFKTKVSVVRFLSNVDETLPDDWEDFLNRQALPTMFYYRTDKKKYVARCACCDSVTILDYAKSGETTKCPCCKQEVELKNTKRTQRVEKRFAVSLMFAKEGLACERIFMVHRVTQIDELCNISISNKNYYFEEERCVLDNQSNEIHSIHPNQSTAYQRMSKWLYGDGRVHGASYYGFRANEIIEGIYAKNISSVLRLKEYKYSQLETVIKIFNKVIYGSFDPLVYLMRYTNKPLYELLIKAKLYGLFSHQYYTDGGIYISFHYAEEGRIPNKITRNVLQKWGLETKADYKACMYYSPVQLHFYGIIKHTWNIPANKRDEAIQFMVAVANRSGVDMQYDFISMQNLYKYWCEQRRITGAYLKASNFWSDYTDYISGCTTLQYDVKNTEICRPKNLKERHDGVAQLKKMQEYHAYDELFACVCDSIRKLVEFSWGDYCIKVPNTIEEVYKEGQVLNHCVAKYIKRVANQESIILFLRKKETPDVPYYTIEIKPDMQSINICQCRGQNNCDYGADINEFLEKYSQWFNRRPMGDYANQLKVKYFKSVSCTKDGRFISFRDSKTEYKVGETLEVADTNCKPDEVAVAGIHMASLEFAEKFAGDYRIGAILELEVDVNDVIVPDADDQVRAKKAKVLREVPLSELGEWGQKQIALRKQKWHTEAA